MTGWLITGAAGQLGIDLQRVLAGGDDRLHALGRAELDITDRRAVDALIAELRPDVVINAAAYTAVDAAESDEDAAYKINAAGPAMLALAVAEHGGRLIQVSTDYVFDGAASSPYEVDDPTNPQSAYGRTKLAGEHAVRELAPEQASVVRTAWVYGASGGNFVKTMARLAGERDTLSVVDDQTGAPTWSADLARGLVALGRSDAPAGIYHASGGGQTTWFGFARAIFAELGLDPQRVQPTTTDAFPRPAPRPAYSVLSPDAWIGAGLAPPPDWRVALSAAFAESGAQLRGAA